MKRLFLFLSAILLAAPVVRAQSFSCSPGFSANQLLNAPGHMVHFLNTSADAPSSAYTASGYIFLDDGNPPVATFPGYNIAAQYYSAGTYTVWITNVIKNNATQQVVCSDTFTSTITVTPHLHEPIAGVVYWDSAVGYNASISHTMVWLIQHDPVANTLTAVDSIFLTSANIEFMFTEPAEGEYLVKAKTFYNGAAPAYGLIPTYHDSSAYWNAAQLIVHTNNAPSLARVYMRNGTPTSGPGFVGGNISSGAGKGTGTGIADMLVLLRNSNGNKIVASAYTDANGNYSFSDIPAGSYNVYPEEMNYTTIPSPAITIGSGQTSNNGIDFTQTDEEIVPNSVLGINPVSKNDALSIYPNPVNDLLMIDNKNGRFNQVTVLNILGQVVKQVDVKKGINKIGMETLRSGIYYLVVKGSDGARSMKITKK
jgi:hypothetical protein